MARLRQPSEGLRTQTRPTRPRHLASMVARYTREVLMMRFNAWRQLRLPALCPTAGYHTDAQRFLPDLEPILAGTGIAPDRFVRTR